MGSKKHKKDSKKKKHRSRSRSLVDGEERERKRHRKHKDRKKERSPDVEEVPVDSHLVKNDNNGAASHSRSRSHSSSVERDRLMREHHRSHREDKETPREKSHERVRDRSPVAATSSGAQESLSVEETNKLRAKLGLKPLEVFEKPADDGKFKDDLGEFYHKPAANIAAQKKSDKIREKLEERKEKRKIEQKLQTTLLAEESDDEDAIAWVKKSREIEKQKQEAAKRAALLDEMDEVFGVSALVADSEGAAAAAARAAYTARNLRGLRVAHDIDALGEERETILTLADKEVLAEDGEDVLVNVNALDDERYKKNLEERKKAKSGYQAYDDEEELEMAALGYRRPVLAKYDDGGDRGRGFVIGDEDAVNAKRFRDMMRQERLQGGPDKRLESLQLPELRLASDYMDEHEVQTKFKKIKKKGKMRKKPKEEPIDVDEYEAGTAPLITDDTDVKPEELKFEKMERDEDEEEVEVDGELQAALARARRMRQARDALPKVEEILERVKEEPPEGASGEGAEGGEGSEGAMVLDATAEFCRSLGDAPAAPHAAAADLMDFERDMEAEAESEPSAGAWSRVDVHNEKPPDLAAGYTVGLDEEPSVDKGVAGALRLALSKGYLERAAAGAGAAAARPPPRPLSRLLAAAHYSIEDKSYGEDDKYGRRERGGGGGGGPLQEFREKANFRPDIKLEYVDDDGRPLCPKEAFRYLSHKFHGKGPGKNKQEKRIKKAVQEGLMKKMSSTDTPLGTLQMLQDKQKETQSPYIVLSGAKRDQHK